MDERECDFHVHGGTHEYCVDFEMDGKTEDSRIDTMNDMLATRASDENVEWESACAACNGSADWSRAPDTLREFAAWLDTVKWDSLPHIVDDEE